MPLYEYECDACGHRFDIIQKYSDGPPAACPRCGKGPMQRQMSSPAIQFKGTGWYVTDYAGKGKSGGEKGEKGEKSEKGEEGKKGEKGAGESTPAAAKAESGSATSESGGGSESKKSETPASTAAPSKDK